MCPRDAGNHLKKSFYFGEGKKPLKTHKVRKRENRTIWTLPLPPPPRSRSEVKVEASAYPPELSPPCHMALHTEAGAANCGWRLVSYRRQFPNFIKQARRLTGSFCWLLTHFTVCHVPGKVVSRGGRGWGGRRRGGGRGNTEIPAPLRRTATTTLTVDQVCKQKLSAVSGDWECGETGVLWKGFGECWCTQSIKCQGVHDERSDRVTSTLDNTQSSNMKVGAVKVYKMEEKKSYTVN